MKGDTIDAFCKQEECKSSDGAREKGEEGESHISHQYQRGHDDSPREQILARDRGDVEKMCGREEDVHKEKPTWGCDQLSPTRRIVSSDISFLL